VLLPEKLRDDDALRREVRPCERALDEDEREQEQE
jgi:hypothetical protein